MYEFDFLKSIENQIKIYRDFPLPVVLCNKNWRVYWSNDLARQYYAHITTNEGLELVLSEFDRAALIGEALESGNCTIQQIVPFSSVNMSITPLMKEGTTIEDGEESLLGMVLMIIRMDNLIDSKTFYQSTHMTTALSDSIRTVVGEVFSVLDVASVKSDLMMASWMKSGFNAVAYHNYRILRIASNISEYSRYQSGILDLNLQPVNVLASLQEMTETIRLLAQPMDIPVVFDLPEEDVYADIDIDRFEQAFFNVLHNAFFYTRKENTVTISLRQHTKEHTVSLVISDKGLGIPGTVLPDAIRPYYVFAHGAVSQGIGLGLTIVKLAMEAHSGSLTIESQEGAGTTVTLTLPQSNSLRSAPLAQQVERYVSNRFSPLYTGLVDATISPFNANGAKNSGKSE